jgi:hypothetical protein
MEHEDALWADEDMEGDDRLEPETYKKEGWVLDDAIADYLTKLRASIPEASFEDVEESIQYEPYSITALRCDK